MDDLHPRTSRSAKAFSAVLEIGTNGLATILKRFRARDSALEETLMELERKQTLFRLPFKSSATLHEQAMTALIVLGPRASPVIPELVNLLNREDTSLCAARALLRIEPTTVSVLIKTLGSERARVRFAIVSALGETEYQSDGIVKALVMCVTDKDPEVRLMAWLGLSQKDPALIIAPIIELLSNVNTEVRTSAVWTLGTFGKDAKAAVAMLLKLREDDDANIRQATRIALRRIDPNMQSATSPETSQRGSEARQSELAH